MILTACLAEMSMFVTGADSMSPSACAYIAEMMGYVGSISVYTVSVEESG